MSQQGIDTTTRAQAESPSRSIPFHVLTIEESVRVLDTSPRGLTAAEATRRLAAIGPNELGAPERTSPWALLAAQFRNVLIVILLIAAALSAALGHGIETIIIGVIVVFAALSGFIQEYRAERAMEALREMAAPTARVLSDGDETVIRAREVVPGDPLSDPSPVSQPVAQPRNLLRGPTPSSDHERTVPTRRLQHPHPQRRRVARALSRRPRDSPGPRSSKVDRTMRLVRQDGLTPSGAKRSEPRKDWRPI